MGRLTVLVVCVLRTVGLKAILDLLKSKLSCVVQKACV